MTNQPCPCRPYTLARLYGGPKLDDSLLPSPEELTDLPDDLGSDHAETDEEP